MTIFTSCEPAGDATVLAQALTQLYQPDAVLSSLRQLDPEETHFGAHQKYYSLSVADLANHAGFDQAEHVGSRYLVSSGGVVRAAIETGMDAAGTTTFKAINAGPFVQGTVEAIRLAESYPADDVCELSVLLAAPLKLMLACATPIHATPTDAKQKRYYVVGPGPAGLDTNRHYNEDELLPHLWKMAQALTKPQAGCGQGAANDLAG
jgi:hypothetical protein